MASSNNQSNTLNPQIHIFMNDKVKSEVLDGRERLFLRKTMNGLSLQDKNRQHLGWFKTEQEARNWCAENNYKMSIV